MTSPQKINPHRKPLVYVMDMRFPNEYAHSVQVVKMCEAYADQGLAVRLVIPKRWNYPHLKQEPWREFYEVAQPGLSVVRLPCLDLAYLSQSTQSGWLRLRALLFIPSYYLSVWIYCLWHRPDYFVTREYLAGMVGEWLKWFYGVKTIVEFHDVTEFGYEQWMLRSLLANVNLSIFTTQGLKREIEESANKTTRTVVLPNGIEPAWLDKALAQRQAQRKLGLASKLKWIVYTGQLFEHKGIGTLIQASWSLPSNCRVLIVGGTQQAIDEVKNKYGPNDRSSLQFYPRVSRKLVWVYLQAADVLVLPTLVTKKGLGKHTSPIKLFEYMAAGRPIVASSIAPLEEILTDQKTAFFFPAGNAKALSKTLSRVLTHPKQAKEVALRAREAVKQYTWMKRAGRILEGVDTLN